jgi:hypothetical protein
MLGSSLLACTPDDDEVWLVASLGDIDGRWLETVIDETGDESWIQHDLTVDAASGLSSWWIADAESDTQLHTGCKAELPRPGHLRLSGCLHTFYDVNGLTEDSTSGQERHFLDVRRAGDDTLLLEYLVLLLEDSPSTEDLE